MAVVWDPLAVYEVAKISIHDPEVPFWPPAASWRGPLQMETVENIKNHNTIFIGYFGRWTRVDSKTAMKYYFVNAYTTDSGIPLMWLYTHCSLKTNIIIRQVLPSPEIHVAIKSRNDVTTATAVAENDRTILEMTVTEDVRCAEFKRAVKKKCVEENLCTNQTDLTIYYENVLMSSNVKFRRDHDNKKRHRPLPKIIAAKDGSISPQSRNVPRASSVWYVPTGHCVMKVATDNPTAQCVVVPEAVRNVSDWTVMVSQLLKNEGVGWCRKHPW